jgi:hypothetical protein
VAHRLVQFLCLRQFTKFTFSGYFDSGAEGVLVLWTCLLMGVLVKCTFTGRHLTSITISHKLKLINLRSYLPAPLFKMANTFGFLRQWTWFPSHEVGLGNFHDV